MMALRGEPISSSPRRVACWICWSTMRCTLGKSPRWCSTKRMRLLDLGFATRAEPRSRPAARRRQNLLFSATFPMEVQTLAHELLHEPALIEVEPLNQELPDIEQRAIKVDQAKRTPCWSAC